MALHTAEISKELKWLRKNPTKERDGPYACREVPGRATFWVMSNPLPESSIGFPVSYLYHPDPRWNRGQEEIS